MNVFVAIGTRPEYIKMAKLVGLLKKDERHRVTVVNTGQHYSSELVEGVCKDLGLEFDYSLGKGDAASLRFLIGLHRPDVVLVHGDTDAAVMAAYCAKSLGVNVGHVEAGLRSFDITMPEEQNRILLDDIADHRFCVSLLSKRNLFNEGLLMGVHTVGNTVVDALNEFAEKVEEDPKLKDCILLTVHRPFNVERIDYVLKRVSEGAAGRSQKVIFPAHPRTWENVRNEYPYIKVVRSEGYLRFIRQLKSVGLVITDSGGVQEEACVLGVPCLVLRPNTEREEVIRCGAAVLCSPDNMWEMASEIKSEWKQPFGDGRASERIKKILENVYERVRAAKRAKR